MSVIDEGQNFQESRKEYGLPFSISLLCSHLRVWHFSLWEQLILLFRGEICFSVWVCWWNPVKVCCLCLLYHSWPHLHQLLQHMDSRREPVQLWICHPSPVPIGQNKPWLKNESPVFAVCALHVFTGSLVLLYIGNKKFSSQILIAFQKWRKIHLWKAPVLSSAEI